METFISVWKFLTQRYRRNRVSVQYSECTGTVFNFIGNCSFPIKLKTLREDRTAADRKMSLSCDPPQAESFASETLSDL